MKNNKGITLVALVITIIVLLILAGVSISMVVGQNGVLGQAKNASSKTNVASASTALQLSLTSIQTDFMGKWAEGKATNIYDDLTEKTLDDELQKNGYYLTKYGTAGTEGYDEDGTITKNTVKIEFVEGSASAEADHKDDDKTVYKASIVWGDTSVSISGKVTSSQT